MPCAHEPPPNGSRRLRVAISSLLFIQVLRRAWALCHQLRFGVRIRSSARPQGAPEVSIAVVVPLLDEAAGFHECVSYFRDLTVATDSTLYLVTSERERTINAAGSPHDTAALAASVADGDRVVHLHVADERACKGDQLNAAVTACAELAADPQRCLVVCYDVDSRPEPSSLVDFGRAATVWPASNVFHQSARFAVRDRPASLGGRVADAAALLQNRFVLSTEVPRLRARHPDAGKPQRALSRVTWIGVTGHGVAARASFLRSCPFPTHRPMEDLHWSFVLAVKGEPVVVVPSFDRSDAPSTTGQLYAQMERWFGGPAGAIQQVRTPGLGRAWWRAAVAISTAVSIGEWLTAVFALPFAGYAIAGRPTRTRSLARALCCVIMSEVVAAELVLGSGPLSRRVQRVALYPVANSVFGAAGWSALVHRTFLRGVGRR